MVSGSGRAIGQEGVTADNTFELAHNSPAVAARSAVFRPRRALAATLTAAMQLVSLRARLPLACVTFAGACAAGCSSDPTSLSPTATSSGGGTTSISAATMTATSMGSASTATATLAVSSSATATAT